MSTCKQCAGVVVWKSVDGKWQCFNADGVTSHWDTCSQRRTARIVATGVPFTTDRITVNALGQEFRSRVTGYKTPLKSSGEQLVMCAAPLVKAKNSKPICACQFGIPPWEICSQCPTQRQKSA